MTSNFFHFSQRQSLRLTGDAFQLLITSKSEVTAINRVKPAKREMGGAQNHKSNDHWVKFILILPKIIRKASKCIQDGFRKSKGEVTTSRSKVVVIIGCTSQTRKWEGSPYSTKRLIGKPIQYFSLQKCNMKILYSHEKGLASWRVKLLALQSKL